MYQKISDLKEGPVIQVFLVKDCQNGYGKKEWTGLVLTDRSGEIRATLWDKNINCRAGTFVNITGKIINYNDELKIIAEGIERANPPENLSDYVFALDELTIGKLFQELKDFITEIQDAQFKDILRNIFTDLAQNSAISIKTAPLTDERYGNYGGALLEHIVYSLRHARDITKNYFDKNVPINKDILYTVLILHDLGRIVSFENLLVPAKTARAKLLGSTQLTLNLLEKAASKLENLDSQKFDKLQHGVAAACEITRTPLYIEAMLAQEIQKMDALVSIYAKSINSTKAGSEFTFENPILKTELFVL